MSMKTYTKAVNKNETPQSEPIPGTNQVQNSAGGFSFKVDDFTRLERFLILGTEGGTYYASERQITLENAKAVEACIKSDGLRTVKTIVDISDAGRAAKNDPAIFALVMCMKLGDAKTKAAAVVAFPKVVRIGTHLFQAAEAVKSLGGWGRGTKRAFTSWYTNRNPESLAMQLAKYQQREGWSHRDVLRKLHIDPKDPVKSEIFRWSVGKQLSGEVKIPNVIVGMEEIKKVDTAGAAAKLIKKYGLPRECVPTQFLNSVEVWRELLMSGDGMPITAMVRNLGKMTSIGLLREGSDEARFVAKRLRDQDALSDSRIHPMQILIAHRTYASGHGKLGSLSWSPVRQIVEALDDAFYKTFKNVKPTGKRIMMALDVSGSMTLNVSVAGSGLTPLEAEAAMALITLNVEDDVSVYGFSTTFQLLNISKKDTLDRAIAKINGMNFGGTDCALPMKHAEKNKMKYDAFFVYTDSETWAGSPHPSQALQSYRKSSGIPAKLVVVGMVSNGFTIADPNDAGMLDVVGFDTTTPALMAEFIR